MSLPSLKNKKSPDFVIFINRKCLKAISSVKTKKKPKFFKEKITIFYAIFEYIYIYTGLGYFITHIS